LLAMTRDLPGVEGARLPSRKALPQRT
jgi:hypothetical protein